ncbi:hypothetical protein AB0N16_27040 [Streptomyces sp. NPDC051105]|uniref:hypothetical protein n=1 Tax=Streptomyces sp. NPDC051105 TaxID=3154843 RepID=UPI00344A6D5B
MDPATRAAGVVTVTTGRTPAREAGAPARQVPYAEESSAVWHWITEEQPQATTDLVVDFLRRAR